MLGVNDAEIEKADFTLRDLHNKKVTLSQLRGKVVLVNFWATWCPPCHEEMPILDLLQTHFASKGLVVLSISAENAFKVASYIGPIGYHPTVLIDSDGKVSRDFHVTAIPRTVVFDANGKMVGQSIDSSTQQQFLAMLAQAALQP